MFLSEFEADRMGFRCPFWIWLYGRAMNLLLVWQWAPGKGCRNGDMAPRPRPILALVSVIKAI